MDMKHLLLETCLPSSVNVSGLQLTNHLRSWASAPCTSSCGQLAARKRERPDQDQSTFGSPTAPTLNSATHAGAQSALRALARSGMKIGRIEASKCVAKVCLKLGISLYLENECIGKPCETVRDNSPLQPFVHQSLARVFALALAGCHSDPHGLHAEEVRTPWTPSVGLRVICQSTIRADVLKRLSADLRVVLW